MDHAIPSRTALRVALRRAAHQTLDTPLIFHDPLAIRILGREHAHELARTPEKTRRPASCALRAFLVARSRYAEDQLAIAYRAGVRQYCLLGAGLDTFAYRNPYPGLRVFEVDYPATQRWKREMLANSGLPIPDSMRFIPIDFEHHVLALELGRSGLDFSAPCFFAWLGVVPYLTLAPFQTTLALIASMPGRSAVTFDYSLPRASLPILEQREHDSLSARVAAAGEPFRLFLTPAEVAHELRAFSTREDLNIAAIDARYFAGRSDSLRLRGSAAHLVTATVSTHTPGTTPPRLPDAR